MNFGFRLPGPFRVGISSKGRVNIGMTAGPFSVSTSIGQRRRERQGERPFYPISVEQAVAELVVAGWTPTYADPRSAMVSKGWRAARIDAVSGGVTWEPVTSRRTLILKTVLWVGGILAVLMLCDGMLS